jgi:hypothetical protein
VRQVATFFAILVILLAMLVTLAAAGLVVAYVAFVARGRDIPHAAWLTDVMRRAVARWHVPTEPESPEHPDRALHVKHGGIRRHRG